MTNIEMNTGMDTEASKGIHTETGQGRRRQNGPEWKAYEDIIDKTRPVSKKHPPMSMEERAAQFSPFAALTGYEAAVKETARLTDEQEELDEDEKAIINERLQKLYLHITEHPQATVTYFEPDERKAGGSRKSVSGKLRKIDKDRKILVFENGHEIQINNILNIRQE